MHNDKRVFEALEVETISLATPKEEIAEMVISEYISQVEELYSLGLKSFMSESNQGDRKTFCLHSLWWYFPEIMKLTYKRHGVGIGVYTMEGFEYKNYTSKQVIRTRTNGKVNITMQSLKTLLLIFKNGYHNIEEEIGKRKEQHVDEP